MNEEPSQVFPFLLHVSIASCVVQLLPDLQSEAFDLAGRLQQCGSFRYISAEPLCLRGGRN